MYVCRYIYIYIYIYVYMLAFKYMRINECTYIQIHVRIRDTLQNRTHLPFLRHGIFGRLSLFNQRRGLFCERNMTH